MFDTSINLTLQRNDMTCNNIFKSLNTVKSSSFSSRKDQKENVLRIIPSSCGILSFDSFIDSELLCLK